ncbi:hypothetical protein SAMN02745194_04261 [Roseomonas rosea]|uniref:Uncharacterized protein n=1 Tax=Muricoccus roseus TaxID=198092 RepID=A0A1M6Q0D4_9PROT|nr:hypothetical protein [Roseomonas rosea]SHK13607.1 hypothetical protein SAMN02745194_04261 [Roseomonas rosea]
MPSINPTRLERATLIRDKVQSLIQTHVSQWPEGQPDRSTIRAGEWIITVWTRDNGARTQVMDVNRGRKLMSVEWDKDGTRLIAFDPGSWDDELIAVLDSSSRFVSSRTTEGASARLH